MSLPRYPEYKDSGIAWLGEVPNHWKLIPLKRLGSIRYGIGEPPSYRESGTPLIRATNVHEGALLRSGLVFVEPDDIPSQRILWLKSGDIIVVRSGAYTGDSALVTDEYEGAIAGFDMVFRAKDSVPSYLKFVLISRYVKSFQIDLKKTRAAQPHLNAEELGECIVVLPLIEEQTAIAAFLDRETAKIDGLIAEQEKLIALLAEKRQATISHAVTRGLYPDAPMKDSGVAWLGAVPAHWEVLTFQRCVYVQEGQVDPETEPFRSMVLIAPNHIESGTGRLIYTETAQEQSAESGKYLCKIGDVVYSKIRPALRKVCIAPEDCLCSADMYPLRGISALANEFLMWFMLSEPFSALAVLESERVAMPKINRESLKAVWLPIPTLQEQREIVSYLIAETTKLDTLKDESELAIGASCKTRNPRLIFSRCEAKWGCAGGHFWHDASYHTNIITPAQ